MFAELCNIDILTRGNESLLQTFYVWFNSHKIKSDIQTFFSFCLLKFLKFSGNFQVAVFYPAGLEI